MPNDKLRVGRIVDDQLSAASMGRARPNGCADNLDEMVIDEMAAAPEPEPAPLIEVGQTSRGYTLYRQENGAGGHRYWSDSIGGGVVVHDTCLASREEVEMALRIEEEFERGQR